MFNPLLAAASFNVATTDHLTLSLHSIAWPPSLCSPIPPHHVQIISAMPLWHATLSSLHTPQAKLQFSTSCVLTCLTEWAFHLTLAVSTQPALSSSPLLRWMVDSRCLNSPTFTISALHSFTFPPVSYSFCFASTDFPTEHTSTSPGSFTYFLLSLPIEMSSLNIIMRRVSCLTSSVSLSVSTADKKGLWPNLHEPVCLSVLLHILHYPHILLCHS